MLKDFVARSKDVLVFVGEGYLIFIIKFKMVAVCSDLLHDSWFDLLNINVPYELLDLLVTKSSPLFKRILR